MRRTLPGFLVAVLFMCASETLAEKCAGRCLSSDQNKSILSGAIVKVKGTRLGALMPSGYVRAHQTKHVIFESTFIPSIAVVGCELSLAQSNI